MADKLALWEVIQSWEEVQQSLGCMLAGRGSHGLQQEHWAAAGREAAGDTPAGWGRTQPDCKALG